VFGRSACWFYFHVNVSPFKISIGQGEEIASKTGIYSPETRFGETGATALTLRRFRGTADMERFSLRNDL
jgi:hypothetical protein